MEIIVEIGSEEQKDKIKSEIFEFFQPMFSELASLKKIIVTDNFDSIVEKNGAYTYSAKRDDLNQEAVAKVLSIDRESKILVISSVFYSNKFDNFCRYVFFLHEIVHIVNDRVDIECLTKNDQYLNTINILLDEYIAYSLSWEIVKNKVTNGSEKLISVFNDIYDPFFEEINEFIISPQKIISLKNDIRLKKINFIDGFAQIEKYLFDYLLKIVIIFAMNINTKIDLPIPITDLLTEYKIKKRINPEWIGNTKLLDEIFKYYNIVFMDKELKEVRIYW